MSVRLLFLLMLATPAGSAAEEPTAEQLRVLKTFRSEFVNITPGKGRYPASFTMGDDRGPASQRPAHRVTFKYDFAIAKYEVWQDLYQAVMGENPSRWKGRRNSVDRVLFPKAQEFCRRATKLMRQAKLIADDEVIRLPSETEWEYACRAGTDTAYSFGDDPKQLGKFAWYTGNAAGNDPAVGAKAPNPWGLYDIHGYLWEWCADGWHENYKGAPADGSARPVGKDKRRVLRSGSWKDPPPRLASRFRRGAEPSLRDDAVGLRCVLAKGIDASTP